MNKLQMTLCTGLSILLLGCQADNETTEATETTDVAAVEIDMAALAAEGKATIKELGMTLKGELVAAIQQGGAVNAIDVCHTNAPKMAAVVGEKHGASLARVSLKHRNPDIGVPSAWQATVLQDFETRLANGEAIDQLVYKAIADNAGTQEFRMMKAIPTGKVCLTCHGSKISPNVHAKLNELYPRDHATGFSTGDIRGAFVYVKAL